MAKEFKPWIDAMLVHPLPILRKSREEMARLSRQGARVKNDEIAAMAYHDPLLTCAVLQRVNRTPRRGLSSEVTTVDHAVMMMGVMPFFEWVRTLPVLEERVPADERVWQGLRQTMARSYHAANQAFDWAVLRNDAKADEVFIAALLDALPELCLWLAGGGDMRAIRRIMQRQQLDFTQAFARYTDYSLQDFAVALSQALKLPDLYVEFSSGKNVARSRGIEVAYAAELARKAEQGWWDESWPTFVAQVSDLLRHPLADLASRIDRTMAHAADKWAWYGVPPAAAWLPMLPGAWPIEPDEAEPAAQHPVPEETVCLMPHPDMLKKTIADISAHLDGSYNLSQLMARVMVGMHEGLALDRVVFALVSNDRTQVKARFVRGVEENTPLHTLHFSLAESHLFTRLMGKMQGIWLQQSNWDKFAPLMTQELFRQVGEGEFFAMSVFVHDKPLGFFYADRRHNGCELDDHSYTGFKQLCLKTAEGLAHLSKKPHESGNMK